LKEGTPDPLWRLKTTNTTLGDGTTALPTTLGKFDYQYGPVNGDAKQRGQRVQATLGNGAFWKYGYNDRSEVTSGSKKWWGGLEEPVAGAQFAYNFDAIGNRTSTTINGQNATYTANNLNQYQSQTIPGAVDVTGTFSDNAVAISPTVAGSELKVHAESSGLQKKQFHRQLTVDNTFAEVWQPVDVTIVRNNGTGGLDEIRTERRYADVPVTPEFLSYDKEGNTNVQGNWQYTWSPANHLRTVLRSADDVPFTPPGIGATYGYDFIGRRISKDVSVTVVSETTTTTTQTQTRFVWDGWRLIAEWDTTPGSSARLLRTYHWGLDLSGTLEGAGGVGGLLAMVDRTVPGGPKTYHYTYDGNGNVVSLVDAAAGTVAAEYEYGPFGEALRSNGALAQSNPFRWSTRYTDEETGLIYYGYRYYMTASGKWLNKDCIGERGGLNLYNLVGNRCITSVDVLGMFELTPKETIFNYAVKTANISPGLPQNLLKNYMDYPKGFRQNPYKLTAAEIKQMDVEMSLKGARVRNEQFFADLRKYAIGNVPATFHATYKDVHGVAVKANTLGNFLVDIDVTVNCVLHSDATTSWAASGTAKIHDDWDFNVDASEVMRALGDKVTGAADDTKTYEGRTNLGEIKTLLGKGIPGATFLVQSGPIPFIQTSNEKWMALLLSKMGAPK
jgi:RHS repeat-associated protein